MGETGRDLRRPSFVACGVLSFRLQWYNFAGKPNDFEILSSETKRGVSCVFLSNHVDIDVQYW